MGQPTGSDRPAPACPASPGKSPTAAPSARAPLQRPQRGGDRVDEDRDHRARRRRRRRASAAAGRCRGRRPCSPRSRRRRPTPRTASAQSVAMSAGTSSGPGVGAVVADARGRGADAERRHQPVEEPVVVVRREDDDQFGVVSRATNSRACASADVDVVKEILRRSRKIQQRAVRHAAQGQWRPWNHLLPGVRQRTSNSDALSSGARWAMQAPAMQRSGRRNSTESVWASNHALSAPVRSPTIDDVGVVVPGPVQLGHAAAPRRIWRPTPSTARTRCRRAAARGLLLQHSTAKPVPSTSSSSTFCCVAGVDTGLDEQRAGRRGRRTRGLGVEDGALLVARHRLEPHLQHVALERRAPPTRVGSPGRAAPPPAGWSAR